MDSCWPSSTDPCTFLQCRTLPCNHNPIHLTFLSSTIISSTFKMFALTSNSIHAPLFWLKHTQFRHHQLDVPQLQEEFSDKSSNICYVNKIVLVTLSDRNGRTEDHKYLPRCPFKTSNHLQYWCSFTCSQVVDLTTYNSITGTITGQFYLKQ